MPTKSTQSRQIDPQSAADATAEIIFQNNSVQNKNKVRFLNALGWTLRLIAQQLLLCDGSNKNFWEALKDQH